MLLTTFATHILIVTEQPASCPPTCVPLLLLSGYKLPNAEVDKETVRVISAHLYWGVVVSSNFNGVPLLYTTLSSGAPVNYAVSRIYVVIACFPKIIAKCKNWL